MPSDKVLMCIPADYPGYVVPGSVRWICYECHRAVWVAPSSWLIMHENLGMEVNCWACAFDRMEKEPGDIMNLTPVQRREIEEWMQHARTR